MSAPNRHARASLCIHAHFYQPPREDPFTGRVPVEYGASPYNNWNERINAECYRPNANLGNFERISFNVGPTLFRWLAEHDPLTVARIVRADRHNVMRHGAGNAMAQAYNHTTLPLATRRDKELQVAWGIADFEHRFGRRPRGMWLAETAVDDETLEVLAARGIEFTILAPWQADAPILDPTAPYRVPLPSGRSIVVFFYERDLSGRVSFDPSVTINADSFAHGSVLPKFRSDKLQRGEPQLVMVATDGELYGHHQKFRDHFLRHLLNSSSEHAGLSVTYPELWLRDHPTIYETRIRNQSSWSCYHGVERWRADCDCTPGDGAWKSYLRTAMDGLAERIDEVYARETRVLGIDPWALREQYISVVLGQQPVQDLIGGTAGRRIPLDALRRVALLLESQYYRQAMYTSCGWFFEDFDRIEPKNNVGHATRAMRALWEATGVDLEAEFAGALRGVVSPRTGLRGDAVFSQAALHASGARRSTSA